MPHHYQDHYFFKAKKEGFLARAVYKLEEIQAKYRILRPGFRVLDLGAAPGSWLQFTEKAVGPGGRVVGVDIKPIRHLFAPHVTTLERDIFDRAFLEELNSRFPPFDVVLSDMAPSTTGIRCADSARSALLFERAIEVALAVLKPPGSFLGKLFQGSESNQLIAAAKSRFTRLKVVKPGASRKDSREIYILATGLRKTL